MEVFEFTEYRPLLTFLLKRALSQKKGIKSKLAKALNVQSTFISQVLKERTHLTPEHALAACSFLGLSHLESQFLFNLTLFERAGTPTLKDYYSKAIQRIRNETLEVKGRVGLKNDLDEEVKNQYYSSWFYPAVHILVALPTINNVRDIASYLSLPHDQCNDIVQFLLKANLIEETNGKLAIGKLRIYVSKDSPNVIRHHQNMRLKSMLKINQTPKSGLHYSGVYSLSKSDYNKLRSRFLNEIENLVSTLKDSKDETLCWFNLDFFEEKE